MLIASIGVILPSSANHLVSLFLDIELISLPLFGLVGYAYRQKHLLETAIKYMPLSTAASSFMLFGMALLYAESGDLSLAGLGMGKSLQENLIYQPLIFAGMVMMIVSVWISSYRWCLSSCRRQMCIRGHQHRLQPSWSPPAKLPSSR